MALCVAGIGAGILFYRGNGQSSEAEYAGEAVAEYAGRPATEPDGNALESTGKSATEPDGKSAPESTGKSAAEPDGNALENTGRPATEQTGKSVSESNGEPGVESSIAGESQEKDYIHWVEFYVTKEALQQAYTYDVETHGTKRPLDWVELLACLGARYGGDFKRYNSKDMDELARKLHQGELTLEEATEQLEYYPYYREAYGAILDGMVGEYEVLENGIWKGKYGLKAFHPIARGFPYTDYDDFGVSRSYGYERQHLGHDMMGQVGTPIIAVESGYVYELGWNQYGGWRIGVNSFDGRRYYYYAHLRQNVPYAANLKKGDVIQAGDVIGYMGRTGYSTEENVNNIQESHLHFGLQLIFDESQRDGTNQIWIDVYPLVRFLYQNQSETVRNDQTKEWSRVTEFRDPEAQKWESG